MIVFVPLISRKFSKLLLFSITIKKEEKKNLYLYLFVSVTLKLHVVSSQLNPSKDFKVQAM